MSWDERFVRVCGEATDDRGRHVVAATNISAGTVVLKDESPLICLPSASSSERDLCDAIVASPLSDHLCSPATTALSSRCTADATPQFTKALSQLYTNSFVHVDATTSVEYLVLYWHISMMNHSCAPNVYLETTFVHHPNSGEAPHIVTSVIASRDIHIGEDINIAYQLLLAPADVRQAFFASHYGFTCSCVRCTAARDQSTSEYQREHLLAQQNPSGEPSAISRRVEKLFRHTLDPLAHRTTLTLSSEHREVVWQMLKLLVSTGGHEWDVLSHSNFYWKAATLREALMEQWDDELATQSLAGIMAPADFIKGLAARHEEFIRWFFDGWLSPTQLARMIQ